MNPTPNDRRYTKTHEWFRPEGDTVTMGITRFAVTELADITYVSLPAAGSSLTAGKTFGEIESVKATSELYSALSGQVVEVNTALADAPELVNNDPYGDGWMIRLSPTNPAEIDGLMDAAAYDNMLAGG